MALKDFQTADTIARSFRGEVGVNRGSKTVTPTTVAKPQLGAIGQLVDKAAAVGRQSLDLSGTLAKKTAGFVANTAIDIGKAAYGAGRTFYDAPTQQLQNSANIAHSEQIDKRQQEAVSEYKSGKMSKEDYIKTLQDLSSAQQDISKEAMKISSGPTPIQRAQDVAETAVNVLSLGSFGLAEVGAKQSYQAGGKEALKVLVDEAATPLEKVAFKIPAVKALVVRNLEQGAKREAQTLAGETIDQYLVRNSRKIAADLLIKRPIFYQSNIGQANSLYKNVLKGDYKGALTDAAWLGVQMIEGGPLGFVAKNGSLLKGKVAKLAYGNESLIDELSKGMGDGNPAQVARFLTTLEKKAPNEFMEAERVFRIGTETNLQMAGNDTQKAVQNILTHYDQRGVPRENITPSKLYKDWKRWQKGAEIADEIDKIAYGGEGKVVAGSFNQDDRLGIINTLRGAGPEFQAKSNALIEMSQRPGVAWGNNSLLMNKLETVLNNAYRNGGDIETELEKGIKAINAGAVATEKIPKKLLKQMEEIGYIPVEPVGGRKTPIITDINDTRKLITGAIKGNTEIFDEATAAQPELQAIAGWLQKAGLSPQAANREATRKLSESVVSNLDELGLGTQLGLRNSQGGDITKGGQAILSKLQAYIENKRPVLGIGNNAAITDIRQLTNGEIAQALSVSKAEAKTISHAIINGYKEVPMEFRGLGDKVVDTLFAYNPLQKYYSRIQSALRYTYNPFFRVQERVETKILSHAQASNLVWNKSRAELNEGARILDEAGIFTSSLPGEAAQDQVLGRITANISQGQKRDLAGLAYDMANARGMTIQQLAREHPEDVDDALRVVVQYPRKGILASPLARTLNLAFFPMRYNFKVTQLAAQTLGKQPPAIQKAVLHSLFSMKDWLKSDEGIRWQSQHADAIQVLNWVTPINSIEYTLNLLGHRPNSVADVGQLGGLPLGLITQILDGQGIINLNRPYVNPKTGDVFPKYIPQTTKARAATALGDLLNSMFTYPGRTLGLPGKSAAIRGVVKDIIDTSGKDFQKQLQTDNLTPLQQKWVQVLKGDTSPETLDSLYNSPAPGQFNWYTLPPLNVPLRSPLSTPPQITRRTNLPAKASKAKKAKKVAIPLSS